MPGPWRSEIGTINTICSSAASARSTSVVAPGIDSAKLKYSCLSDLQKYGALKSSLRQMICAPRPAASRMRAMVAVWVCVWSPVAASWRSQIVTCGVGFMTHKIKMKSEAGALCAGLTLSFFGPPSSVFSPLRLPGVPLHRGGDRAPELGVRVRHEFLERVHHVRDFPVRTDDEQDALGIVESRILHVVKLRDLRVGGAREEDRGGRIPRPVELHGVVVGADADDGHSLAVVEDRGVLITVRLHLNRSAFCPRLWKEGEHDGLAAEIGEVDRLREEAVLGGALQREVRSHLTDLGALRVQTPGRP